MLSILVGDSLPERQGCDDQNADSSGKILPAGFFLQSGKELSHYESLIQSSFIQLFYTCTGFSALGGLQGIAVGSSATRGSLWLNGCFVADPFLVGFCCVFDVLRRFECLQNRKMFFLRFLSDFQSVSGCRASIMYLYALIVRLLTFLSFTLQVCPRHPFNNRGLLRKDRDFHRQF